MAWAERASRNVGQMIATLAALAGMMASAQGVQTRTPEAAPPSTVERATSGDSPDDPGPLATDLSPALTHADISKAAAKVASWELARTEVTFNQQWTYAALYDGMLAATKTTGDSRY